MNGQRRRLKALKAFGKHLKSNQDGNCFLGGGAYMLKGLVRKLDHRHSMCNDSENDSGDLPRSLAGNAQ